MSRTCKACRENILVGRVVTWLNFSERYFRLRQFVNKLSGSTES